MAYAIALGYASLFIMAIGVLAFALSVLGRAGLLKDAERNGYE